MPRLPEKVRHALFHGHLMARSANGRGTVIGQHVRMCERACLGQWAKNGVAGKEGPFPAISASSQHLLLYGAHSQSAPCCRDASHRRPGPHTMGCACRGPHTRARFYLPRYGVRKRKYCSSPVSNLSVVQIRPYIRKYAVLRITRKTYGGSLAQASSLTTWPADTRVRAAVSHTLVVAG